MDERKPHFVGKARATGLDGRRIPVEREQEAFSTQGLENACRVPAPPERRIDIVTIRFECERRERFLDKHWRVLIHGNSSSREAVRDRSPKCRVADPRRGSPPTSP